MLHQSKDLPLLAPVNNMRLAGMLDVVSRHCKIGMHEMRQKTRIAHVVRARHIFFYACSTLTTYSYTSVGNAVGGKDHATVIHGVRKVATDRKYFEPELSLIMAELEAMWIRPRETFAKQKTERM